MILSCKYRLYPNKNQELIFEGWINTCRALYNVALEERIYSYKSAGVSITKYEQYNELPELKKQHVWVSLVHSDVLQETLDRVDKSFKNFFSGAGFPKFKKKDFYNSFTFKRSVSMEGNKIKLPKIGLVKFKNSRNIENIKTATIIKENSKWFISVTYEVESKPIIKDDNQAVGIDVGVKHHSYLSDGTFFDGNYALESNLKLLRTLNRKLSRAKKDSNKRAKLVIKLRNLHTKIKNQRKDFNHKLSTLITDKYSSVYMEDLKLSNMIKLNSTLSRRMLDNAFYNFRIYIDYKCKLKGKYFSVVPPHYTSQTCPSCGNVDKESRKSQSEFRCTNCNYTNNADYVGALNILGRGTTKLAKRKAIA